MANAYIYSPVDGRFGHKSCGLLQCMDHGRSGPHVCHVVPDAHFTMQVDVNKRLGLLRSELQKLKQDDRGRKAKTTSSSLPPGQEGLALERCLIASRSKRPACF